MYKQLLFLFGATSCFAAVEYDFQKGIDLIGHTRATAAHYNQLVDNATLTAGRGLVLITNGTPNTADNPRYTNYLWVDTSVAGSPTLKFYVAGLGWTNSLVGATITETNIANGAITTPKLANGAVTSDKITSGSVGNLQLGGSSVTTDKIAVGAVTRGVIADGAVGTEQLTNSAVTTAKIAASAVTSDKISTVDWLTITNIAQTVNLYPVLSLTNWAVNAGSNNVLFAGGSGTNAVFKSMFEEVIMPMHGGSFVQNTGYVQSVFHTLGYRPQLVQPVFEFTNTFVGYQVGDQIGFSSIAWSNAAATRINALTWSVNSTGIFLRCDGQFWTNSTTTAWTVPHAILGAEVAFSGGRYLPTNLGYFKFYIR